MLGRFDLDQTTSKSVQLARTHKGPPLLARLPLAGGVRSPRRPSTPDGQQAVSASEDQTLKVWDLASGAELRTLAGHFEEVTAVAVMPDSRRAVSASYGRMLKVWDLASGAELVALACD